MKKKELKISIVTVCFNSGKTIEDTIRSVLKQKYTNYEYIIIDGKSTDNTLDIVKKYEPKFKGKMKVISEKDKGLYDAMNKGIKLSSGDIIGTINSDDILGDEYVFNKIVDNFDDSTEVVYGDVIYKDSTLTKSIRYYISGERKGFSWCPAHPTMYIRKEVFDKVGYYNLKYKVGADYDMMTRLNKSNINFKYIKEYLVYMRLGGASNGLKGYLNGFKDAYTILKDNKIKFALLITIKRSFHTINQYIIAKFKRNTD